MAMIGMLTLSAQSITGVLVVVSYGMSGWRSFLAMLRNPKSDITVLLLTFFLTIIFDLTVVLSGVNEKVETVLKRNNFQRIIGEENICNHIDLALARAKEIVG